MCNTIFILIYKKMDYSQVERQPFLIRSLVGSNPSSPTNKRKNGRVVKGDRL